MSVDAVPLFENAEGVLCLGRTNGGSIPVRLIKTDSVPLAYRDTVLPDGTPSRLYVLPYASLTSRDSKDHFFVHWQFPDGVRILLDKDSTSFFYPSGLTPGLYNLVSKHIEVAEDFGFTPLVGKDGKLYNRDEVAYVDVEYFNSPKQSDPYSKPYPREDCKYRESSMFAKVKVIDRNEYCETPPRYYVRIVDADSDEKADFDVHIVKNFRWGTDCAQWQWVDSGQDFCVTFSGGGEFSIRIIDK